MALSYAPLWTPYHANSSFFFKLDTVEPESIRQVGGWGGAVTGVKIGGVAGAAIGIEMGSGAIVTSTIGAIIFGAAGYIGADWVADFI